MAKNIYLDTFLLMAAGYIVAQVVEHFFVALGLPYEYKFFVVLGAVLGMFYLYNEHLTKHRR